MGASALHTTSMHPLSYNCNPVTLVHLDVWYNCDMSQHLALSDLASSTWETTIKPDAKLAETLNKVFDEIENGTRRYQQYVNHARFTTLSVPGRDDQYMVVWEVDDEGPLVLGIGRVYP